MKTVLLIDDDSVFRTLIARSLEVEGWRVLGAEDGESGLQLAFEHRPDVILCDLLMPRCNGFQVCRAIRARRDVASRIRIVVTTGSAYTTDRVNALEAGADAYLVKPVHLDDLLHLMRRWTDGDPVPTTTPGDLHSVPATCSTAPPDLRIRFWGVRGSIPTPGPATVFYGGNTSCVEIRADGQIIILDAGTGIRGLGQALEREFATEPLNLTLLVSHTHWDHIQGFPFFIPAYRPQHKINVMGYEGARKGLEGILSDQMESPYFPVSLSQMSGNITVTELRGMEFQIGPIHVRAQFLNHPGICAGYRLTTSAGTIAYLPDNEPFQRMKQQAEGSTVGRREQDLEFAREQDQKLIDFIRDVDVLIIDAQYTADEYRSRVGWGHGCVDDVVAIAVLAGVRRLHLFHHDPDHDDDQISRMVAGARRLLATQSAHMTIEAAREGDEILLRTPAPVTQLHG